MAVSAGCSGDLSTLAPAGPAAGAISTLWWIMLVGAIAIFLLVAAVLALALLRPALLRALGPDRLVVWGGIVLPGAVLATLVTVAFILGERLLGPSTDHRPLRVEAEARQWHWTFRYEGAPGLETVDTLHIPAGRPIDVAVTSVDVIHSFWIPQLGGKVDAIPGHANTVRLRADRPGLYGGVCAEFCGAGHSVMWFSVEAHPAETYSVERLTGAAGAGGARP